ncbi:MAG: 6-phosphogluconolactonase [Armatimonadetes bacterium]|nr:MAG: 6-phosphogluconolactonase [Armatimonadota bacterium]
MDVEVYATIEGVARAAADLVEDAIAAAPELSLGLAGGSTPPLVHRNLAARNIGWERVTAWMTDERWVPRDHQDSNQRMARETLVDATGVSFLAPDTSLNNPQGAALAFEHTLKTFGIGGDRRSVVMLGMGPDGHTASLFPDTEALTINDRLYVANWVDAQDSWRLTATYHLLNSADTVLFVVTGGNKAEMVKHIADGAAYPAANVDPRGETHWILDEDAASLL